MTESAKKNLTYQHSRPMVNCKIKLNVDLNEYGLSWGGLGKVRYCSLFFFPCELMLCHNKNSEGLVHGSMIKCPTTLKNRDFCMAAQTKVACSIICVRDTNYWQAAYISIIQPI